MKKIEVTKLFDFEMAHALYNYDGKCAYIHGHSYHLEISLAGVPNKEVTSTNGMVIDFSTIKKVVNEKVLSVFDHALALNQKDPRVRLLHQEKNLIVLPYQPTCENLLLDIVTRLKSAFSENIQLSTIILSETKTSYSKWKCNSSTHHSNHININYVQSLIRN